MKRRLPVLFVLIAFALLSCPLYADNGYPVPFRFGNIVGVKIMPTKGAMISIKGISKYHPGLRVDSDNASLVIVQTKLAPGRSISIMDFKLEYKGQKYPCLGLAVNQIRGFDFEKWQLKGEGVDTTYSMLFKIPTPTSTSPKLKLCFALFPTSIPDVSLPVGKQAAPKPKATAKAAGTSAPGATPAKKTAAPAAGDPNKWNEILKKTVAPVSTNLVFGGSAKSSGNENNGRNAKCAIDGDMGSRWSSKHTDGQWWSVDLGKTVEANEVVIHWENAYAKDYDLKYRSNTDGDWKDWKKVRGSNGKEDVIRIDKSVKVREIKLQCIKRATEYGVSFYEFELYNRK